jgi:predicted nucleic acid-binding protein
VNGFLLDTNVVSELRKRERCAPKVNAWAQSIEPNQAFLSVLVVGELVRGAISKQRADRAAADALEQWIARLTHLYGDRILPITLEIAQEWGRLSALRPIPPEDGLLAATARVHHLTLVTRNTRNVQGLGVSVMNPWV